MPHAGLMNEAELGPEKGPLQRARLHMRGGRRRLRQGKYSAGILTIYDALSAAMEWYLASAERRKTLEIRDEENIYDDKTAFDILQRSGVLKGQFDFMAFDRLVENASNTDFVLYDYDSLLTQIESLMLDLKVMPFDEADLPPEDPSTF